MFLLPISSLNFRSIVESCHLHNAIAVSFGNHNIPFPFLWKKGDSLFDPYSFPLILSLKTPEHIKMTTLPASSIRASLVCGFLPLHSFFSFTQNFPNTLIKLSSPFSRLSLMISKRDSNTWVDLVLESSTWFYIDSIKSALVRVIGRFPFLAR